MTTFGWKRKRQRFGAAAAIFSQEEGKGEGGEDEEEGVDWLSVAKKRRVLLLEDSQAKSKRLQNEGAVLAESQRYWEAIKYWDEAIELTPGSAVLHEMKSQAFSELGELFPAVEAAERAVWLHPTWAIALRTLARAQTGIGEIEMALSNLQKSFHLDPTNTEVRDPEVKDDIQWVLELLGQKQALSAELCAKEESNRDSILQKRGHSKSEGQPLPPQS